MRQGIGLVTDTWKQLDMWKYKALLIRHVLFWGMINIFNEYKMYKNITVYRCITNINNKRYVSTKSSLSSSVLLSENITDFCLYLFSISSVFTLLIISSTRVLLEEKNFSKSASVNFVISFLRNSTSRDRSSLSLSNALCWDSKSKICGNKRI